MIFHCPACSAGHTVPVSMIPNGGMDMTCRRCSESFLVDVDEPDVEEEDPTVAARAEATAIGVANPYDELVPGAHLISPAGEVFDPHDASDDTEAIVAAEDRPPTHDKPTIPIDQRRIPLGPDELGVDPELDNTQRFDVDEEEYPTQDPSVIRLDALDAGGLGASRPPSPRPATPPPRRVGSKPKSSVARPPFDSQDLYAKVASGKYERPEPSKAEAAVPRERAWNEPSSLILTGGSSSRLRRFAERLNQAPLALKVALIVFPVTLGLTLVLTAGGKMSPEDIASVDSTETIRVGADGRTERSGEANGADREREAEARTGDARSATGDLGADSDAAPDPEPDREPDRSAAGAPTRTDPTGPLPPSFDRPAPPDHAYVQAANARLRATASRRGRTVARLDAGQLVRRYDAKGDYALVLVEPDGPVGFVAERSLGASKPIVALADDLAFEGCSPEGRTVDTCLFEAKQKEGTCVDRCGATGDPSAVRCKEACGVAFDRCTRGCQPPKRRRRRR